MENKVLLKNIAHIEAYDSELANKLLRFENEKSNLQLAQSENGEYNLFFRNELLHDPTNPTLEANNIAQKIQTDNALIIVYGLGLGYLPDIVAQKVKDFPIIIYEPNIEIIHYVLSIAQIDALFQKNVILCQNKVKLYECVKNLAKENTNLSISFLNSYKKLFFDDIKKTFESAQMAQGEKVANKNTLFKKSYYAFSNAFKNIDQILKNPDITMLKDVYKGKTALILCAGPSLEKNIEIVAKNQNKFVIFALNPTLKLLSEKNIIPDFVFDIETADNYKQFENVDLSRSCLVAEPFIEPKVMNLKTRKTFNYISQDNFINPWFRDCFNIKEDLKTYGSVSSTAFYSALLMGFEKIIMLGQDLAYSDGKCYAKGAQFEELECIFDEVEKKYKIVAKDFEKFVKKIKIDRITDEQALLWANEHIKNLNDNIHTVLSQENKPLPTQYGYAFFIDVFSKMAIETKEKYPDIELINSSTGGAQINGFVNLSLDEAISELKEIEKINFEDIQNEYDKEKFKLKYFKTEQNLKKLKEAILNLQNVNKALYNELNTKKIFTNNANKLLLKHVQCLRVLEEFKKEEDLKTFLIAYIAPLAPFVLSADYSDIKSAKEKLCRLNFRTNRALTFYPI